MYLCAKLNDYLVRGCGQMPHHNIPLSNLIRSYDQKGQQLVTVGNPCIAASGGTSEEVDWNSVGNICTEFLEEEVKTSVAH